MGHRRHRGTWGAVLRAAATLFFLPCVLIPAQQTPQAPSESFQLKLNVSKVLVPVVVHDSQGNSVSGLQQGDFKVFDNGKQRPITGFMIEQRGVPAPAKGNDRPPANPATASADAVILPDHITVFMVDDLHISFEDLARAREAIANTLPGLLTGTDMAAVISISGRINTGLLRDPAKLKNALTQITPQGLYRPDNMDCPNIDYYEADLIENKHDAVAVQDGNRKYANCNPSVSRPTEVGGGTNLPTAEYQVDSAAMRSLNIGRQDVLTTYGSIATFVKRMAQLPGQRTLILVSPGFLNIEREVMDAESRLIDLAAQSGVIISSLDARGLYVTTMTANQKGPLLSGPSVQVNMDYNSSAKTLAENAMAELADGTGGVYFHNNNDLDKGIKELTGATDYVYILEISTDEVKRNGSFHRLSVKVDRPGAQLQARRGYFMPRAAKDRKSASPPTPSTP